MLKDDRCGIGAFVCYLILAFFFFGRGLAGHFSDFHIGEGADPELMMWFLVWWPYALRHGINPFLTHAIWVPTGFNVAWSTSVPLISLIAAPLTSALGPIVSLNVFCLLSLPVAAWCAFLLCRYVSGNYVGSALGGYIFGFSPSLLGQLLFARLHSVWMFPVPLIVYLALRWFQRELTTRWLSFWLALLFVIQFLLSPETFVSMTVFGGLALVVAWLNDPTSRDRLASLVMIAGCAYVMAVLLVSPYLYIFFKDPPYSGPMWSDRMLSADLLNFIIPNPTNQLGRLRWFAWASGPFNWGEVPDTGAFLSWPLIAIAAVFARRHWREQRGRLLVDLLVVTLILALGPVLVVRGHATSLVLPWRVFQVATLRNAAPVRFCQYGFLILGLMTALWLSSTRARTGLKIAAGAGVFACLLPNLSARYWNSPVGTPEFFKTDLYRKYISPGEAVFILPVWPRNDAMMWQAQSNMYFNLAQGAGPWPAKVANWPILDAFVREEYVPHASAEFKAYLTSKRVGILIVDDRALPVWRNLVSGLGIEPQRVGGVSLYRFDSTAASSTDTTLYDWRRSFDEERLATLIMGVQRYLAHGGKLDDLIGSRLLKFNLIPAEEIVGPPPPPELPDPEENWDRLPYYRYGMILLIDQHRIAVGETAWRPVAEEIINRYRKVAAESHYIPPQGYRGKLDDQVGVLVMSFDRAQMAQAAAIASEARKSLATGKR